RLRSAVIGRDGRFQETNALAGDPFGHGQQHAQSQTLAAHRGVYRDLPDEQLVRSCGWTVAGDETDQLALCIFGRDGGVGEMCALQKVAIDRIGIQRVAACYLFMEGKTVAVSRATERYGRNSQNKAFGVAD